MPQFKSDIKPRILQEVYDRLGDAFAGVADPIIIGGRAVNIYCYKNERFTHDIDIVLSGNVGSVSKAELTERLTKHGFIPEFERDNLASITDMETGIKIDIYYIRDVSGIPIDVIAKTAEVKEIARESKVKVVNPAVLIAMKINSGRPKDMEDIRNIISSLYKNPRDIVTKESQVFEYLDEKMFLNALSMLGIETKEEAYRARR